MSYDGLRNILKKYGEERHAKLIARAVIDSRYAFGPITTTTQLADIVTVACDGLEHTSPIFLVARLVSNTDPKYCNSNSSTF